METIDAGFQHPGLFGIDIPGIPDGQSDLDIPQRLLHLQSEQEIPPDQIRNQGLHVYHSAAFLTSEKPNKCVASICHPELRNEQLTTSATHSFQHDPYVIPGL
jgi:hypothetical protein